MQYTQEQLTVILDNHKKWLLSESGGIRADLEGADLRGANLIRADLRGAKSDYSVLLSISGMRWNIVIKDDMVKVGCQEHTYTKWKSFSNEEISKMDSDALVFYSTILVHVLDGVFKGTKFEIKY